jgi:hypothetical protein
LFDAYGFSKKEFPMIYTQMYPRLWIFGTKQNGLGYVVGVENLGQKTSANGVTGFD